MTTKEKIDVMVAYVNGEEIECLHETSIEPSLDDYVFMLKIKRTK